MKCILSITLILMVVESAKLPQYLKKCRQAKDNSKCVQTNQQTVVETLIKNSGDQKFKLQGLAPIHVAKIDLQATPQLRISLADVDFFGFDTMKALPGGYIDGESLRFKGHIDKITIVGKYDINGKLLVLPIQGQGACNITMVDFDFEYNGKLQTEERKNKMYYKILSDASSGLSMHNMKRLYTNFENLFNGDKRLGPEMNRFLNENWKDVYAEVKPAMEKTAAYSIVNYFVNGYLHFVPINDLFEE